MPPKFIRVHNDLIVDVNSIHRIKYINNYSHIVSIIYSDKSIHSDDFQFANREDAINFMNCMEKLMCEIQTEV